MIPSKFAQQISEDKQILAWFREEGNAIALLARTTSSSNPGERRLCWSETSLDDRNLVMAMLWLQCTNTVWFIVRKQGIWRAKNKQCKHHFSGLSPKIWTQTWCKGHRTRNRVKDKGPVHMIFCAARTVIVDHHCDSWGSSRIQVYQKHSKRWCPWISNPRAATSVAIKTLLSSNKESQKLMKFHETLSFQLLKIELAWLP